MVLLTLALNMTAVAECDPLRDIRHREARAARDLADWLAWLELGNYATRTLDAYEKYGARLLNAFPRHAFSEFTDGDLMHVLKLYPQSSRLQAKAAWNNWFKWGFKQRRIPGNPVDLLPDIKYRTKRDYDVFTEAELAALFALPAPHGQLQVVIHRAGFRRQECIMLKDKRIDLDRLRFIIVDGPEGGAKGGKGRTVPMVFDELPIACADLRALERLNPDDHLWASRPGGRSVIRRRDPISSSTFDRWWHDCFRRAGVRYRNPHIARHTCATRLRELRVDPEDLKWMLGHESIRTTLDTYSHPNMDDLGERVRELVGGRN